MLRSLPRFMAHLAAGLLALPALMTPTLSRAGPVTIGYEVNALVAPGRYEYRYTLANVSLATPLSWFSIDFDPTLYDEISLVITTAGLGDWSQQILGSVLANPAQYDAYNGAGTGLNIGDALAGFTVDFTWLGAGAPGSQAFTVYDPANLNLLDTGVTTPVGLPPPPPPPGLPEPASVALVLLALGGAAAARRRSMPAAGWSTGATREAGGAA